MKRTLSLLAFLSCNVAVLHGQEGTEAASMRSALSAAPPAVAAGATVMDHDGKVLREGRNGWVCMPDMPEVPNDSPMCLDAEWRDFIDAWMNRRPPSVRGVGIAYMLQSDMPVSNVDPFAEGPAPGNEWLPDGGPHIMLLVPDAAALKDLSSDATNGGPWVMWRGTPYAHVMIPTVPRRD